MPATPSATPPRSAVVTEIVYTVRQGDTPSVIRQWFVRHGDGMLYDRRASVLDSYLRLIVPGTRISVSDHRFYIQFPD